MKRVFPLLALLTAGLLGYALYQALVVAPTERTMGDVQRIFYYHVPSAWTAFLLFFINFLASVQFLVRTNETADRVASGVAIAIGVGACIAEFVIRPLPAGMHHGSIATTGLAVTALYFVIHKLFSEPSVDILAQVTAEVGVVFCTVVLVTGPLWRARYGASGGLGTSD